MSLLPSSSLVQKQLILKDIKNICTIFNAKETDIQPKTKLYNHLALQFSDFQLKSFVDPKPVEL